MAAGEKLTEGLIVRIDDRLMHGQIIMGWGMGWPANELWLVNDRVSNTEIERDLYLDAIPEEKRGGVISLDEFVAINTNNHLPSERVLVVVESCHDAFKLQQLGVAIDEIHLGNQSSHSESGKSGDGVYLSADQINILSQLVDSGIHPVLRPLPESNPVPLL